jgi:hypothetical protein
MRRILLTGAIASAVSAIAAMAALAQREGTHADGVGQVTT